MSPFAGYPDFQSCVGDNSDKASPEGFCAWLEHEVTGAWPGQMADGLPFPAIMAAEYARLLKTELEPAAYAAAVKVAQEAGWSESRFGWVQQLQAPKMKTVANITIFAGGTHTDSAGQTREWSDADLDKMLEAFVAHVPATVPLKAGHTTDGFNTAVAEALEVPVLNVTGDMGQGQISLGNMISLQKFGNLLVAAFDRVPEPIANLIEGGQYSTVSVEIEDAIGDFGPAITGVALLGAEEPAVAAATTDRALVFGGSRAGARVLSFKSGDLPEAEMRSQFADIKARMTDAVKGLRGAPLFRGLFDQIDEWFEQAMAKRRQEGSAGAHTRPGNPEGGLSMKNLPGAIAEMSADAIKAMSIADLAAKLAGDNGTAPTVGGLITAFQDEGELAAIAAALGMDPATPVADLVAAIEAMKAATTAAGPGGEMKAEFTKMTARLTTLEGENASLKHKGLVAHYRAATSQFKAIEGTADALAEELAKKHEQMGEDIATAELTRYQKADELAAKALKVPGSKRNTEQADDFESKVQEFQKADPKLSRVDAIKAASKAHPDLWYARDPDDKSS
jgi:hypothetical protein